MTLNNLKFVSPIEFVSPLRPNTVNDGFVKPFLSKDFSDGFVKPFHQKNRRILPIEFVSPLRLNTVNDGFVKPFQPKDFSDGFVKPFLPKNRPYLGDGFVKPLRQKKFCRCGFAGVVCFDNKNVESIEKKDVVLGLFKFIVNTFARYLVKKV